ncbi:MAG: hypothetical protein LC793_20175, partial [Thermomicrobia bacterium]|nr:hypothetical protein [Thermomicrobia bacterium]
MSSARSDTAARGRLLAEGGQGVNVFRYRTTQGVRALLAPLTRLDSAARDTALAILPPSAATAFRALPKADQQHALPVRHQGHMRCGGTTFRGQGQQPLR